jgi:hypothetical protein
MLSDCFVRLSGPFFTIRRGPRDLRAPRAEESSDPNRTLRPVSRTRVRDTGAGRASGTGRLSRPPVASMQEWFAFCLSALAREAEKRTCSVRQRGDRHGKDLPQAVAK